MRIDNKDIRYISNYYYKNLNKDFLFSLDLFNKIKSINLELNNNKFNLIVSSLSSNSSGEEFNLISIEMTEDELADFINKLTQKLMTTDSGIKVLEKLK